jgi:hypothetical protein
MASQRESTAALLRQRRFLVLMSLALAGFYVLKVHVRGEAEYSGLAVALQRPGRVQFCLWVVFGWAFLRYVQRLNQLWRRVGADMRKEADDQDQRLALKALRRFAVRKVAHEGLLNFTKPRVVGDAWIVPSIKEMIGETRALSKQNSPKAKPDSGFMETDSGGRKYRAFGLAISDLGKDGQRSEPTGHNFEMPAWSPLHTRAHRARACVRAAIRLPAVFEHLAPLAMALAAVVLAILLIFFDHCPPGLWA